jgi:UDP-glucuronate 4-epimerase
MSLYAATKISNEVAACSYGNMYQLPNTGLRFFTVYGPNGRPDMALFLFAEKMRRQKKIPVFNHGKMDRDFTYVDDIVHGVLAALQKPEMNQVYNLARGKQEPLMKMIQLLEAELGIKAEFDFMPMQPGDVPATSADISRAQANLGYAPSVSIEAGIAHFVQWYKTFHP